MGAIATPVESIASSLDSIKLDHFITDGDRSNALRAAYALVGRLESPWETVARLCMNQPAVEACLKLAKDVQLFEKWHKKGDLPAASSELAAMVGVDPELLGRILRHLAANHLINETAADEFAPTRFSLSLLNPLFGEWISYLYDTSGPCFYVAPEYLRQISYKNPTDPADGVFQATKDFKGDVFDYYAANPREGASFNHVMGGVMANQASWLDVIPAETFLENSDPRLPLVVDVGGNVGHDIEKFRQRYPEKAAQLYLEDKPTVIALSQVPDPVNKLAHDFFQAQPIKNSRVYYMHGVLHDWSDEPARRILEALRGAMKTGYSKLLIHDHVIPDVSAHPHATAYDLTMMVTVAGKERTETEWHSLLHSTGYKVVKVWKSPLAVQSIIEAELE